MKAVLLALAMTGAATTAALAQRYPAPLPPGPPVPYGLTADEARDYRADQIERRQDMERDALHARQKAERRLLGVDDD